MGRSPQPSPKYLGKKLKTIRECLGITTFDEMISRLNIPEIKLYRASILRYEKNEKVPPLLVLLRYSEISGVSINDLVDDKVKLSAKLQVTN